MFRWCVSNCAGGNGCVMLPPAITKRPAVECTAACPAQFDHPVPRSLRLLRWSCEGDCRCAGCTLVQCSDDADTAASLTIQLVIRGKCCSKTSLHLTSLPRSKTLLLSLQINLPSRPSSVAQLVDADALHKPLIMLPSSYAHLCTRRYRCMQVREGLRRQAHSAHSAVPAVVKYYGKWPFTRVLGMQVTEPQWITCLLLTGILQKVVHQGHHHPDVRAAI